MKYPKRNIAGIIFQWAVMAVWLLFIISSCSSSPSYLSNPYEHPAIQSEYGEWMDEHDAYEEQAEAQKASKIHVAPPEERYVRFINDRNKPRQQRQKNFSKKQRQHAEFISNYHNNLKRQKALEELEKSKTKSCFPVCKDAQKPSSKK